MPARQPAKRPGHAGIHVGDVGGNVSIRADGDVVGRDKISHITISVDAVTQQRLITTSPYRGLERFENRDRDLFFGRDQVIAAKFSGPPSKMTPLQRLMKWSVSDRRSRAISPFSRVTVSEWLENRMKEGTEGLRAARQVDPANARVTAHLGRCLADYALKAGGDPDEARRGRGEADFLTSRALELAPDNDEVKKLRDEVVKFLELKTN